MNFPKVISILSVSYVIITLALGHFFVSLRTPPMVVVQEAPVVVVEKPKVENVPAVIASPPVVQIEEETPETTEETAEAQEVVVDTDAEVIVDSEQEQASPEAGIFNNYADQIINYLTNRPGSVVEETFDLPNTITLQNFDEFRQVLYSRKIYILNSKELRSNLQKGITGATIELRYFKPGSPALQN